MIIKEQATVQHISIIKYTIKIELKEKLNNYKIIYSQLNNIDIIINYKL